MMDKKLFRELSEVIGRLDIEIQRINFNNESLSVEDTIQILAELEDKLTDVVYDNFNK